MAKNLEETSGKLRKQPQQKFAQLLDWHLTRGTRPVVGSKKSGVQWGNLDFGYSIGVDERTVRNWRRGRSSPKEISSVERELFGNDSSGDSLEYADWRRQLREAHASSRNLLGAELLELDRGVFFGVPSASPNFTGRSEELELLHVALKQAKTAAITQSTMRAAIQGMGGIGKTTLAVEYAHRFRNEYAGVWWCAAESRSGLVTSLASLGIELGVATEGAALERAARAALRHLKDADQLWLLIYDNVTTPDILADLLPHGGAGVIITSRFSDWGSLAEEIALDVLPVEQAIDFLQSRAKRTDQTGAKSLAVALGLLPLALDHAAAICKRTQMTFTSFAERTERLISLVPRGVSYPRSVAVTFQIAIKEALDGSPASETLMTYLSFCAPERIPIILLAGTTSDDVEELEALSSLAEVSLLKQDPYSDGTPAITVHRLVQAAARARQDIASLETQNVIVKLIRRLAELYPADGYRNPVSWNTCAQLTPHVLAQREWYLQSSAMTQDWPRLINRVASYLQGRALYSQAEPLRREALALRQLILGEDHPETADSYNDVALVLYEQGDLDAAEPLYRKALSIQEEILGEESTEAATTLNNLALLVQGQGRLEESRSYYEKSLAIREKLLGPEHPNTVQSVNNLGFLLHPLGNLSSAEKLFERALAARQKMFGEYHPDTAQTLNNLANLLLDKGEYDRALDLSNRALKSWETVLGADHPSANLARGNLARIILASGGNAIDAYALAASALERHKRVLGERHWLTKYSAEVTANSLDALGKVEQANELRTEFAVSQN